MVGLCTQAISSYLERLKGSFQAMPTDEGCIIVTPFLRSDNECIELELIPQPDGRILLTDNADTIDYLFVNGLNIERSRDLKRNINRISERFGVEIVEGEIFRISDPLSLGATMQSVLSTIQDISYLIYKKQKRGPTTFDEQVEKFLIGHEIRYDPRFEVRGKAYGHTFRFHVNDTGHKLIHPLTATTSNAALAKAERLAFRWGDIQALWPEYRKVAVLDDIEKKAELWVGKPLHALQSYSDEVIQWSSKERLLEVLSGSR